EQRWLFPVPAADSGVLYRPRERPWFRPGHHRSVVIEVGTSRSLDMTLKPESQIQSVTVTAAAPELVTDRSDRGNVIESQFVQNTPLNIRNPLQLVNFAQGVTAYVTATSSSGNNDASQAFTNTFRINGGKMATTESLLDGGANTTLYDYNAEA